MQRIVLAIRSRVNEGDSLANALGQFPGAFPTLFRATVEAGEQAGKLDHAEGIAVARRVLGRTRLPVIVGVTAPGFAADGEKFALTVALTRITFPYLIMTLVAVQLSAMLNAIEKFWAGAFWSNLQNLAMIGTIVLWHWFPNAAYAAAWGVLAGGVAQLVFMIWAAACPTAPSPRFPSPRNARRRAMRWFPGRRAREAGP